MPLPHTAARGFVPLLDRFEDMESEEPAESLASALIIEDDDIAASLLERFLWDIGYRSIERAGSRIEALKCAYLRPPDLVVADVWLGGDGPEGIRTARTINTIEYSAVVFVTATPEVLAGDRRAVVLDKARLSRDSLMAAINTAKRCWPLN